MIKKNTILSTFNKKYTLMEWLKRVEKALKDSVLVDVTIITLNATQIQFSFNFEDGSHIITPIVTLPKGDKGDKGDKGNTGEQGEQGVSVVSVTINTSNHLIVTLSDGTEIDAGVIQGGGTITVDDAISSTSENPVQNKVIYIALQSKQNALTTSSVVDGTIDKIIGFDANGDIVKALSNDKLFVATYNVTTISEVTTALSGGKLVCCYKGNDLYFCDHTVNASAVIFTAAYYENGTLRIKGLGLGGDGWSIYQTKDLQSAITRNNVIEDTIINYIGLNNLGYLCKQSLTVGTKLYEHNVLVGDSTIIIINNISTPCSSPLTLSSAVKDAFKIQIELGAGSHNHNTFDCLLAQYHSAHDLFGIDSTSSIVDLCRISSTTITIDGIDYTVCSDTVTEL